MSGPRSCTIFVGNIPYDASEDDLKAIFSRVGSVDSFRLVYDKDTKQPKGYGFCDYTDADTALSAIRNLTDVEFNGRKLRVDLADNALRATKKGLPKAMLALPAPPSSSVSSSSLGPSTQSGPPPAQLPLPALPMPAAGPVAPDLPAGPAAASRALPTDPFVAESLAARQQEEALKELSTLTDIAKTVMSMPPAFLQVCLGNMQELVTEAPEEARALLEEHPQLSYALLHAQMLFSLGQQPCAPPTPEEFQQLKLLAASRNPTPKARGPRPVVPTGPAVLPASLLGAGFPGLLAPGLGIPGAFGGAGLLPGTLAASAAAAAATAAGLSAASTLQPGFVPAAMGTVNPLQAPAVPMGAVPPAPCFPTVLPGATGLPGMPTTR